MNNPEHSNPEKGENDSDKAGEESAESREESLAERSARLEAEAASMYEKQKPEEFNPPDGYDPLDPEPLPEEITQAMEGLANAESAPANSALQEELDAAKDQLARALAEAENTRRRAQKEREDASKFAISKFAKDLLEVSDNLRRALEAFPSDLAEAEPRIQNMIDGIEATERSLLRTFEKNGIVKLEPLDEPFDPNFHEVMFEAPVPGKPAGIVMQVVEAGYLLNERLIRPARVGVTNSDGGEETPPGAADPSTPGGQIDTKA